MKSRHGENVVPVGLASYDTAPKKTEAGNPDFRVWDGKQHITGYIEAKDPAIENLDRISAVYPSIFLAST